MRISDWSSDVCSSDLTASWQTLTSESNADELSVDITFPGGLVHYDDGKHPDPHARSVAVPIQYREVGDVSWLTPTFSDKTFPDSWVSRDTVTVTAQPDRKSVVEGTSVSVRVDPGGRRSISTTKTTSAEPNTNN